MLYLKKLSKSLLWSISLLFILTLLLTIFSYFNIFNDKITSIFKIIIPIISLFIGGINIGKQSNKKGWIEGLKLGIIIILILTIINLIFINNFELKNILYYIILIITTILGSMIGINRKRT